MELHYCSMAGRRDARRGSLSTGVLALRACTGVQYWCYSIPEFRTPVPVTRCCGSSAVRGGPARQLVDLVDRCSPARFGSFDWRCSQRSVGAQLNPKTKLTIANFVLQCQLSFVVFALIGCGCSPAVQIIDWITGKQGSDGLVEGVLD
jgi:hypothetical protein